MTSKIVNICSRTYRVASILAAHHETRANFNVTKKIISSRLYATEKGAPSAEHAPPPPAMAELTPNEKKLTAEIENLTKEVETLKQKTEELTDKYKRSLAESENLRIRLIKQIDDAKIFGIQNFCKDLLDVADILGHATAAVPQSEITDANKHLKSLYEGLTMTRASLAQVFKRHGLVPIEPLNQKFDPNLHEALFEKEDKNVEPSTVIEVSKIGYKLHERCLRPALVGISKS